jgi:hypothetical protein
MRVTDIKIIKSRIIKVIFLPVILDERLSEAR